MSAGAAHLLAAVFAEPVSVATDLAQRWWEIGQADRLIDRRSPSYRAGDSPPDWAPQTLKLALVLLSILEVHEQLDAAGVALPEPVARHTAGRILRDHGISLTAATVTAARLPHLIADPVAIPTKGWPAPRASRMAPPLDSAALSALRSASTAAWQAGDPLAGTTHLLASVLRAADSPTAQLLRTLGVDPKEIAAETSRRPS